MSLPQALKSQFTKSFYYHRENYPDEDYSTTFENCMNHTEFGEGNLIAFEELFGIGMNADHTLEEVGQQFSVTRERIRQIEAKALRKLKHPSRSRKLRSFLDQ